MSLLMENLMQAAHRHRAEYNKYPQTAWVSLGFLKQLYREMRDCRVIPTGGPPARAPTYRELGKGCVCHGIALYVNPSWALERCVFDPHELGDVLVETSRVLL